MRYCQPERCDMIQVVLYTICMVAILLSAGQIVIKGLYWFGVLPRYAENQGLLGSFAESILMGLLFLTSVISIVSLAHPITGTFQVALSFVILFCGGPSVIKEMRLKSLHFQRFNLTFVLLIVMFITWSVCIANGQVLVYDTGTYHTQAVLWMKEYGVAPGLANLFGQLGYNSAWHLFCSFLDHGPFDHGKSYHVVNLIVFIYFLAFCLEGYQRLVAGRSSSSIFIRLFGFFSITFYYRSFIASMGNDFIAAVLVHYCVVRTSEIMENPPSVGGLFETRTFVLVTALSAFAVTIKLSVVPCLLFPFIIWLRHRRELLKLVLPCIGISVFVGLPFLVRNYILTGYLVYPQTQLDFFQCDWKVPANDVRWMVNYIKEFAIGSSCELDLSKMSISERLITWLRTWRSLREVQCLLVGAAIGLGACLFILLYPFQEGRQNFLWRWSVFCTVIVGVLFGAATAPEWRFFGAWGLAVGYYPCAWMASSLCKVVKKTSVLSSGAMVLLIVYCLLICIHLWRHSANSNLGDDGRALPILAHKRKAFLEIMWQIRPLPEVTLAQVQSANGVTLNIPVEGNQLWDSPLPSAQRLHPWLQMRGAKLSDGFRVTRESGWVCYDPQHRHNGGQLTLPKP